MEHCHMVRNRDQSLSCFYHEANQGIWVRLYENNKWGKPRIIVGDAREGYTVCLDQNGSVYLFCQDTNGDILLCTVRNGEWERQVILENRSETVYPVQMHAILTDTGLSLLYNLPSPEDKSNYLVFQKLSNDGQWTPATRIDKIHPLPDSFFHIQNITNKHLLAFYMTRTSENIIGYREITSANHGPYHIFHSSPYTITDYSFLTTHDAVHVLYVVRNMFTSQLVYRKKETDTFGPPVTVWEGQRIENILLFIIRENIYAAYMHNGQLYICLSDDKGKTFGMPSRYRKKFCLHPVKATYLSAVPQAEQQFFCRQVYVDQSGLWDIQLLPELYEDFFSAASKPAQDTLILSKPIQAASVAPVETDELDPFSPEAIQKAFPDYAKEPDNPAEEAYKLKKRLEQSERDNDEKNEQINRLTERFHHRNEEIVQLENTISALNQKFDEEKSMLLRKINRLEDMIRIQSEKEASAEEPQGNPETEEDVYESAQDDMAKQDETDI